MENEHVTGKASLWNIFIWPCTMPRKIFFFITGTMFIPKLLALFRKIEPPLTPGVSLENIPYTDAQLPPGSKNILLIINTCP